jgi:hypothetical protein
MIQLRTVIWLISLNSMFFSAESVALVLKKKGEVQYKPYTEKKQTTDLNLSESLYNHDFIKTGSDGFTKFVYLDDGSAIKLHKDSEVNVQGSVKNRKILKQITLSSGKMKLDINPQISGEFTVITPTSVASVKGTRFWINCSGNDGDKFYGLSGTVEVTNSNTGQKVELVQNSTVTSLPDGTLEVEPTKPLDLQTLEKLEEDADEPTEEQIREIEGIQPGKDPDDTKSDESGPVEHELRIRVQNSFGDEKDLIIKYSE